MPKKMMLPALAFTTRSIWEETDAEVMSEHLNTIGTARVNYSPRKVGDAFRSLSLALRVGELTLSANSCSAVQYRFSNVRQGILIIPMEGMGEAVQEKRAIRWQAGQSGAFVSCADVAGYSTLRSVAGVSLDQDRLECLARHMLGVDGPLLEFNRSRSLPFKQGGLRFDTLFRHLLAAVEGCSQEPPILDRSGLDDAFFRAIVMWLKPEAFIGPGGKGAIRRPGLDDACDYIRANLEQKITLTQLELVSGMSPRVLQYAFKEKFGCSPMRWVRDRRLETVRNRILQSSEEENITAIASQYFSNLGDFSRKYNDLFGELPSRTRALRHR